MQEDNMYTTSSAFLPKEPVEQKVERDLEADQVLSSVPQINAVLIRLKERAEFYRSVEAIDESLLVNPEEFMHVIAGNKLAAAALKKEITGLENLLTEYTE